MTGLDYAIVAAFPRRPWPSPGWASRRLIKDSDDFFVAGRELTPFILAATITATNLSMFHFIGHGRDAYQKGISIIWQNWTGDMALVLSGIFVVPIMRRLRVRSMPEFLEMRYSRSLRVLIGGVLGPQAVFLARHLRLYRRDGGRGHHRLGQLRRLAADLLRDRDHVLRDRRRVGGGDHGLVPVRDHHSSAR